MTKSVNHETEGLLSPFIRDIRLRQVAQHVPSDAIVLDLACGAGFLRQHLPSKAKYIGVDVLPPPHPKVFDQFISLNLRDQNWPETLLGTLTIRPTIITTIAFLEHLSDPTEFLKKCRQLLPNGGEILGTTPHPVGRKLHDTLAGMGLCSKAGAKEHETFLSHQDLQKSASQCDFDLTAYKRFLCGLNQYFSFKLKPPAQSN